MAIEVLACPSCRAPGPLGPDARSEYMCMYCGTRFHRMPVAAPAPIVVHVPTREQKSSAAGVLIGAGVVGLIVAAVGFFVSFAPSEAPVAEPARSVQSPITIEHAPRHTVSAPAPPIVEPEPEPPATATFDFHRIQSGYKTSFYALGFVTNTSPFVIDKPKIIAVLLDAEGKEVATDFGFAERDVLAPEERSPIKILVSEPPEHASIRYEVIARKASYIPAQVAGLRIEPSPPRPAKYGKDTWEIEGKVHNEGNQPAKFVSIEIQTLDAEGKLVGLGSTYADAEVLAPGAMARYSTQVTSTGTADHFEFAVGSRVAD